MEARKIYIKNNRPVARLKYTYLYVLQGNYGTWEDLAASENRKEMLDNKRDYEMNEGGAYRIIKRREKNTDE